MNLDFSTMLSEATTFSRLSGLVGITAFIRTPIFFDLDHVNGKPSTIRHRITIGIESDSLKSDNSLINQVLNFMLQIDEILSCMSNTS